MRLNLFYLVAVPEEGELPREPDPSLSPEALARARRLGRGLAGNPLNIRVILASPALKAIQMADTIHDFLKVRMSVLALLAPVDPRERAEPIIRARMKEILKGISMLAGGAPLLVSHLSLADALSGALGSPEPSFSEEAIYRFESAGTKWKATEIGDRLKRRAY